MLSLISKNVIRSAISVNAASAVVSKRFLFKSPFASVLKSQLFYIQNEEPDEENCPKAKVVILVVFYSQEFDDLMEKKKKEKKPDTMDASQKKDEDYPFDLEEEDYVIMVCTYY